MGRQRNIHNSVKVVSSAIQTDRRVRTDKGQGWTTTHIQYTLPFSLYSSSTGMTNDTSVNRLEKL